MGDEAAEFQNMTPRQHSRENMIIEVEVQVLLDIPQQEATSGGSGASARSSSCPQPASTSRDANLVPSEFQCGNHSSPTRFSLPHEHFCSLFPFHVLLDSDGMLVQVSFVHGLLELVVRSRVF